MTDCNSTKCDWSDDALYGCVLVCLCVGEIAEPRFQFLEVVLGKHELGQELHSQRVEGRVRLVCCQLTQMYFVCSIFTAHRYTERCLSCSIFVCPSIRHLAVLCQNEPKMMLSSLKGSQLTLVFDGVRTSTYSQGITPSEGIY